MRRSRGSGILLASIVLALVGAPTPAVAAGPGIVVSFHPPGLVLRGRGARLHVFVDGPSAGAATGIAHIRGNRQSGFVAVPLDQSLSARIPRASLAGKYVDAFVVVRDPATGRSTTVPAGGATAPDRSWIVTNPPTVALGPHTFGNWRAPQAVVAVAGRGAGPGQVGIRCGGVEGTCGGPSSFDFAPNGTLWVVDALHRRLLGWAPGHADRPVRRVPLTFAPVDLAIGPDGTFYVSQGDGNPYDRVHALNANGTPRWTHPILTLIYNAHVRIGPDGGPYSVDGVNGWVPIADAAGRPLSLAAQQRGMRAYQPVPGGRRLILVTPGEHSWLTGIATAAGVLQRVWRVATVAPYNVSTEVTPATVQGDPVTVAIVPDIAHRRLDLMVTRLASTGGLRDHFFISRGAPKNMLVTTDQRVGPDGALYVMQLDPAHGIRIVRYSLDGASPPAPAPSPGPSDTPTPTAQTPTGSPVPIDATATPGDTRVPIPSADNAGHSAAPWVAAGVAGAVVVAALAAFLVWRRRRSTSS